MKDCTLEEMAQYIYDEWESGNVKVRHEKGSFVDRHNLKVKLPKKFFRLRVQAKRYYSNSSTYVFYIPRWDLTVVSELAEKIVIVEQQKYWDKQFIKMEKTNKKSLKKAERNMKRACRLFGLQGTPQGSKA
jgi:hypothetical protein